MFAVLPDFVHTNPSGGRSAHTRPPGARDVSLCGGFKTEPVLHGQVLTCVITLAIGDNGGEGDDCSGALDAFLAITMLLSVVHSTAA